MDVAHRLFDENMEISRRERIEWWSDEPAI